MTDHDGKALGELMVAWMQATDKVRAAFLQEFGLRESSPEEMWAALEADEATRPS